MLQQYAQHWWKTHYAREQGLIGIAHVVHSTPAMPAHRERCWRPPTPRTCIEKKRNPRARSLENQCEMRQSCLTSRNGLLGLQKPERKCTPPYTTPPDAHEWLATHLDAISLGEPGHSAPAYRNTGLATVPPALRRYSRRYRAQYELWNRDGKMAMRKRPREISTPLQLTNYSANDNIPTSRVSITTLPLELRLQIYSHLLLSNRQMTICPSASSLRIMVPRDGATGIWPQILATCRLINHEATPIMYSQNKFHREFCWPQLHSSRCSSRPWPRSLSCHLSAENLHSVHRVLLLRQYDKWLLRDNKLKVFRDFPWLRELHIWIDFNDPSDESDLHILWLQAMRSAARKQPPLKRLKCDIRLDFCSTEHRAWAMAWPLDFSIHKARKSQLQKAMREEDLFPGRQLYWSFETDVSEYCGPSCRIEYVIDEARSSGPQVEIPCRLNIDTKTEYSTETV